MTAVAETTNPIQILADPKSQLPDVIQASYPTLSSARVMGAAFRALQTVHCLRLEGCDEIGLRAILDDRDILTTLQRLEFTRVGVTQEVLDLISVSTRIDHSDLVECASQCGVAPDFVRRYVKPTIGLSELRSLSIVLNNPLTSEDLEFARFSIPVSLNAFSSNQSLFNLEKLSITINHPGNDGLLSSQLREIVQFARAPGFPNLCDLTITSSTTSDVRVPYPMVDDFVAEVSSAWQEGIKSFPSLRVINGESLAVWGLPR